jgi:hypothetical protein
MIKKVKLKIKVPVPNGANITVGKGDKLENIVLYDIDQLEVLEEVKLKGEKVNFNVKDGQYVGKGDIIFTEGFMGHKAMVSDFSGIVEILPDRVRILGQKRHIERTVNIPGQIVRIAPNHYVLLEAQLKSVIPAVYFSESNALSPKIYLKDKSEIVEKNFKFPSSNYTYFINDNLYIDELSKVIAFGAKRVIVNGLYIDNLQSFTRELNKLDGLAVISGFGEIVSRKFILEDKGYDVFWGKHSLFLAEEISKSPIRVFEHPFWGVTGKLKQKDPILGELEYSQEKIEVYLKNIEYHRTAKPKDEV